MTTFYGDWISIDSEKSIVAARALGLESIKAGAI
jgi:hypothetical protein